MNRWTSRKLAVAMFWQAVFTVLLWAGKVPADTYEWLTTVAIGGYLTANVMQRRRDVEPD